MMKYLLGIVIFSYSVMMNASPRSDSNFAFGGATTNTQNATDIFSPELGAAVEAAGLELVGLNQQMSFAEAALADINSSRDVFWLWAGTNNILVGSVTGEADPSIAPSELKAAMVRLYNNLNARIFVVPNLMLLGNIPQFNFDPEVQAGINALTAGQNALLAQAIAEFSAEYKDTTVISLDIQSLFLELEASGEFANTSEACFTTGLPNGIPCSDYLYADDIHFSSAAAAKIAELTLLQLDYIDVRRLITLGDSFVDTGSFYNTTERAIGFGIPTAPSFEGRFSDGPNVIDHLESILLPELSTSAFSQPSKVTLSEGSNALEEAVDILIPANLTVTNESSFGLVFLSFGAKGYCWYFPDGKVDGQRRLSGCLGGLKAGQTVMEENVLLIAPFSPGAVTMDLYYY